MRVSYHPGAVANLRASAEFYQASSPGLAQRFLRELDVAIAEVAACPKLWPRVGGDVHCRVIGRFPFALCYRD